MNFLPIQVKAPLLISHAQFRLTLPETWENALKPYDGQTLILGIRPEHLSIAVPAPKNLPVQVERIEALGSETYASVRFIAEENQSSPPVLSLPGRINSSSLLLQIKIDPDRPIHIGEELWLSLTPNKIHLFVDDIAGEAIAFP
jgi:multiple sugar transport system ATP-binding protein